MSDLDIQLWVRTDSGQVYGPLGPNSVELLLDNGVIQGRVQLSTDGSNYVYPGRAPGLRMFFPRELWGDTVVPGDELDAQWKKVTMPPPLPTVGNEAAAAPAAGGAPGGPTAGPGARAPAAGPGVRAPVGRPPGAMRPPQAPSAVAVPVAAGGPSFTIVPPPGQQPVPSAPSLLRTGAAVAAPPPMPVGPVSPSGVRTSPAPSAPPRMPVGPASPSGLRAAPAVGGSAPSSSSASGFRSTASSATRMPAIVPPPAAPAVTQPSPPSAMPPAGSLLTHGPMELYCLAAGGNLTGRLALRTPDRSYELWFKKGSPQFVESSHPDDALEVFVLREGLCQPAQLAQARAGKAQYGGDLLTAFFAMGLLNPNVAFQQLAQRALVLLGHALLAEDGTFTWSAEELPAAKSMPLGNRWAAYLEPLRRAPAHEIQQRMQDAMNLPVMRAGGLVPVENVRLLPQEARALTFFDGVRSLAQLIADLPAEADTLVTTAWMLRPLELVSFADAPLAAPPPRSAVAPPPVASVTPVGSPALSPPGAPRVPANVTSRSGPPVVSPAVAPVVAPAVAPVVTPAVATGAVRPAAPAGVPGPPPAVARGPAFPGAPLPTASAPKAPPAVVRPPAPPPAAPAPAVSVDAELKQLQALREQMMAQTHLDVLGVKKDADAGAVKVAYFKLAKSYHPDTVLPGTAEAIAKAKADVFALVSEANRVLSDPKLKAEYLAELEAGGTGEKVDVSQIFLAEELFQKGSIMVKARKFADAVKMLDDAIKANAEEGEYFVWRGYAKFYGFTDRKQGQAEAMKDIAHGLKKNPNIVAAQYFMGVMAKLNGDNAGAKKAFQQCVKLDPQHIDAQRELRMMK
jgi:curved DNA-binding protein CbpA